MTDTNGLGRNKARFVVTTAIGVSALLGASLLLSACGKLGDLNQAPPFMNEKAAAEWSTSQNPDGGVTMTTTDTSASRETERALPDADADNSMENPYTAPKKISEAPLEGFGNAANFNNAPNK